MSFSWPGAETLDCESRIERECEEGLGLRLIQLPEIREGGGEKEVDEGRISIDLDAAAEPCHGLLVRAENQLGATRVLQPLPGETVARRKSESLVHMSFGLWGAADKNLCEADPAMSRGQVRIQDQCTLEFGNGLVRTLRLVQDAPQNLVGQWIVWPSREHPADRRFGRAEPRGSIVRQKGRAHVGVDSPDTEQCVDVIRIKLQGALKKNARLRHVFQGNSLVE
ncbi:MAG TPA: hypothetical protein VFE60_25020 [Roseiarcus sp.]|nr:hypothetical protein [Roseiarcus sp.]